MHFTKEELEMMKQMGIPVPASTTYKTVRATTKCKLCNTITVQFIRMAKCKDGIWIKDSEIEGIKVPFIEELQTSISTCWACKETLLKKEKADLVQMLIDLNSFAQPKETRKKYVASKKVKKGEEDEG
jgi:hypothetical protein